MHLSSKIPLQLQGAQSRQRPASKAQEILKAGPATAAAHAWYCIITGMLPNSTMHIVVCRHVHTGD